MFPPYDSDESGILSGRGFPLPTKTDFRRNTRCTARKSAQAGGKKTDRTAFTAVNTEFQVQNPLSSALFLQDTTETGTTQEPSARKVFLVKKAAGLPSLVVRQRRPIRPPFPAKGLLPYSIALQENGGTPLLVHRGHTTAESFFNRQRRAKALLSCYSPRLSARGPPPGLPSPGFPRSKNPPCSMPPISESSRPETSVRAEPSSACPSRVVGIEPTSCPAMLSLRRAQNCARAAAPVSNSS